MQIETIIYSCLAVAIGALFTFWISILWKKHQQVDNHEIRINKLEDNHVSEERVRIIVNQSNEQVMNKMSAIESSIAANTNTMHTVLLKLAKNEGYEEGLKASNKPTKP